MTATTRPTRTAPTAVAVVVMALAVGYAISVITGTRIDRAMLPWITGRGFGIGAYLALTGLAATGLWVRPPARFRIGGPRPATLLWLHAGFAAGAAVLV